MFGLDVAPEVLLWGKDCDSLRAPVEQRYHDLLMNTFAKLCDDDSQLADLAAAAGPEALRRVLRAPRAARRLLWPSEDGAKFFHVSLIAEQVTAGAAAPGFYGWTADCRAFVADGQVARQPSPRGSDVVVDLASPHALQLDLMGGSRSAKPARQPMPNSLAATVRARLDLSLAAIDGIPRRCVDDWMRVIVAQTDDSGMFWSGSNGQYVGRVMLVNVDRPPVEEIVDAVVHESIHGFLYMHESVEPWVTDEALYTDEGAVESPWSGQILPVRPFMQACFVWYGLTTFWAAQLDGSLDTRNVQHMLARALGGFRGEPLVDLMAPFADQIAPAMLDVIGRLQTTVCSLLG